MRKRMLPAILRLESRRLMAVVMRDDSFGDGGLAPGGNSVQEALGRQSDGSTLFVVNYGSGPWVYALRPDGSYKPGFNFNAFSSPFLPSFVLAGDDKIYAVEQTRADESVFNPLPTIHRNLANGAVDPTFTVTTLPLPGSFRGSTNDYFSQDGLAVDSHGRALVLDTAEYDKAGTTDVETLQTYIDRLLPNGGRDTSFGSGGRLLVDSRHYTENGIVRMFVGPDDKPLMAISFPSGASILRRFTTAGAIDTSFGTNGELTLPQSMSNQSIGVAFDASGRLLVAYTPTGQTGRVVVRRYTTAGALDTSFASGGVATLVDNAITSSVTFLRVDPQQRIVGGSGGTLFRLRADGTTDLDFGGDGTIATGSDYLYDTTVTADAIYAMTEVGKGNFGIGRFIDTQVARYDAANHLLTVTGSNATDSIAIQPHTGGVRVRINNLAVQDFTNVDTVQIDALGGNDQVNVSVDLPVGVNLGNGNDRFTGTTGILNVTGGAGNDTITTADGDDVIDSGTGDDSVIAGNGRDHVTNPAGADVTDLGAGGGVFTYGDRSASNTAPQTVIGSGGVHTRYSVQLGSGADIVSIVGGAISVDAGGAASNRITALARVAAYIQTAGDQDTIVTGDGNDSIFAYTGRNRISAAGGDDTITSGYGRDTLNCGDGNDVVIDAGGNNRVYGGAGNDSIRTGAGHDVIFGDAGNDTIRGGRGDDSIDGGSGRDHLFGSFGNDTLVGGSSNDTLVGGPGADYLIGNAGNDFLIDSRDSLDLVGIDQLDGGSGIDRGSYDDDDIVLSIETRVATL